MINFSSKTIVRGVLILIVILGFMLATNQNFARRVLADEPALLLEEQPPKTSSDPSPNAAQTKVYIPLAYKVEGLPPVELLSAWTENAVGAPQTAFLSGDEVRYVAKIINRTGSNVLVDLKWFQSNPCEEGWIYNQKVELIPGEN